MRHRFGRSRPTAEHPTPKLERLWLAAYLLPGSTDPRASCLEELSLYTGKTHEEVERLCKSALEDERRAWYAADRRTQAGLREFYDRCEAYLFELMSWHALQDGTAPAWNARLIDVARRFRAKSYLDFGGGIGTNGILLAREGLEVTVADVSSVLQAFARWRFAKRGLAGSFLDLNAEKIPRESYDLISAIDVLEHVPDPISTLRELRDALAPGGILVFDVIASKPDANRPFHLLRSKFPIRARTRALGFARVESFQKYIVYRKVTRGSLARGMVGAWDRARWRCYYLAQGKWPSGARGE
ncbi:MAG: class I SAM-dependent methyltransferase [Planctomycetes bacterium]|nr:class I SAM-dependent methyltransferase [Planctomycetota bacterium]